MGFSAHFLKTRGFLLNTISGELTDENLMNHVSALNKVTRNMLDLRELADCRGVTCVDGLSAVGVAETANIEVLKPGSLLAILISESDLLYGMARAYQAFSEEKRKDTEIFSNLNDALRWLANDDIEYELLLEFVSSNAGS